MFTQAQKVFLLLLWGIWTVIPVGGHAAPTLWGYTGLINIPTADLVPDGHAVVGMGYVHRPYGYFDRPTYDNATYYTSVGFLPFLDLYMRVTRICGQHIDHVLPGYGSNKDRSAGLRVRVLREQRGVPALLVGLHDLPRPVRRLGVRPGGKFYALYVVGSKTVGRVRVHAGYATDWFSTSRPHFSGPFGGVECMITRWLTAMAEHDTHKVSAGLRGVVSFHRGGDDPPGRPYGAQDVRIPMLGVDIVILGLKKLSGGVYVQFGL